MEVQAVLFNKKIWSIKDSVKWLKEHDYKPIKPVHTTESLHRFRLKEPYLFDRFRIKNITGGVSFVLGMPIKNK